VTAHPDCDILATLNSPVDSSRGLGRVYVLVVICETAVIAGLWLLGRFYS
jgi:hypothetical protein